MSFRFAHLGAILIVLWLAVGVAAQEYPAQKAARLGYEEFAELWRVVEPLQNRSWHSKDCATLLSAAPDIQNAVTALNDIKYESHNNFKYTAFKNGMATLTQTAADYADAARNVDSTAVLQLFQQLHNQIEKVATALLPIPWPQYEKLSAASHGLSSAIKMGADKKDILERKMIETSADVDAFAVSPTPEKLRYRAKLIADEQGYFIKLAARMKATLASGDMSKFSTLATELDVRLRTFSRMYLE